MTETLQDYFKKINRMDIAELIDNIWKNDIEEKNSILIKEKNDPNMPEELKIIIKEVEMEYEKEQKEQEEYLKNNPNKKIIGYNSETFEPIFGNK